MFGVECTVSVRGRIMTDKKRIILNCMICICLCFIWGNSLLSREQSAAISDAVCGMVKTLLGLPLEDAPDAVVSSSFIIRKLAHLSEFCILSILFCARVNVKKLFTGLSTFSFVLTAAVASIDETIQIFSNRGAAVRDVLIDCIGAAVGLAVWLAVVRSKRRRRLRFW